MTDENTISTGTKSFSVCFDIERNKLLMFIFTIFRVAFKAVGTCENSQSANIISVTVTSIVSVIFNYSLDLDEKATIRLCGFRIWYH